MASETLEYDSTGQAMRKGASLKILDEKIVKVPLSRNMVVCHATKEAGAPHREYINRKKENGICTSVIPNTIETTFARDVQVS